MIMFLAVPPSGRTFKNVYLGGELNINHGIMVTLSFRIKGSDRN